MMIPLFVNWGASVMFFVVTLQFTFPPTLYKGSLPTLIVWFFSSLLWLNSNSLWACCSFLLLDLVCPEFRDWIFQFSYSILHLCVMHCSPGLSEYLHNCYFELLLGIFFFHFTGILSCSFLEGTYLCFFIFLYSLCWFLCIRWHSFVSQSWLSNLV